MTTTSLTTDKSHSPYKIRIRNIEVMGMDLVEWRFESCTGTFAVDDDWATLYSIKSEHEGRGHATILLKCAKHYFESIGKRFGGTAAIHPAMCHLYRKLGITEYTDPF